MERRKASEYPRGLLDLFHEYQHGHIDRRSFLNQLLQATSPSSQYYSCRRAIIGSMRAARAGTTHASAATATRITETATTVVTHAGAR